MFDLIIRHGTVVDGSGAEPFQADVAVRDGAIVAVGQVEGTAKRVIDATGLHVMPGFIDIHTHYDGQASWDECFVPSIYHGVTTLVMGNCGVGFAPVRPGEQARLIDLMEGVEEIPGSALAEGIRWNWESFTEYGEALDRMPHSLDFMTLVPHDALRLYVMGDRAERGEPGNAQDLEQMAALLKEALEDGAVGLGVGSSETHRTSSGRMTPSFEVSGAELNALAGVLKDMPHRVIQVVDDYTATRGSADEEKQRFDAAWAKIEDMARVSGSPLVISWMDRVFAPRQRAWVAEASIASNEKGHAMYLGCAPRGVGVLNGLDTTSNLLRAWPAYREIAHLQPAQRAAAMREPAFRARLLAQQPQKLVTPDNSVPPLVDWVIEHLHEVAFQMFPFHEVDGSIDYEPDPSLSIGAQAKARGVSPVEVMLDHFSEGDGTNLVYFPIFNYGQGNLDCVREMLTHPYALSSLADAGAHVGTICDASFPTTMISHWALRRTRGERLPLPFLVNMLTERNARFLGLKDRGVIAGGMKADINIVDLEKLSLPLPQVVRDLPAGGRRMVQKSRGYVATLVSGEAVAENGEVTSARPGHWVRAHA